MTGEEVLMRAVWLEFSSACHWLFTRGVGRSSLVLKRDLSPLWDYKAVRRVTDWAQVAWGGNLSGTVTYFLTHRFMS